MCPVSGATHVPGLHPAPSSASTVGAFCDQTFAFPTAPSLLESRVAVSRTALFAPDRGSNARELVAVTRAVSEIVEDVGHDVRVRRRGIDGERHRLVAVRAPDPPCHDDEITRRIEPRDFHANSSGTSGARIRPVKK